MRGSASRIAWIRNGSRYGMSSEEAFTTWLHSGMSGCQWASRSSGYSKVTRRTRMPPGVLPSVTVLVMGADGRNAGSPRPSERPVSLSSRSRPKPYPTAAPRPGTPSVDAPPETRRVVAIQPKTLLGEVEANLARIEDLVDNACREHSPDIVFVPESMTTPNLYHRA